MTVMYSRNGLLDSAALIGAVLRGDAEGCAAIIQAQDDPSDLVCGLLAIAASRLLAESILRGRDVGGLCAEMHRHAVTAADEFFPEEIAS